MGQCMAAAESVQMGYMESHVSDPNPVPAPVWSLEHETRTNRGNR